MSQLLKRLQGCGFDIEEIRRDEVIECRRGRASCWYFYITSDKSVMMDIRESLRYPDVPLMFILVKSDEEFESDKYVNMRKESSLRGIPVKLKVHELIVPESWL